MEALITHEDVTTIMRLLGSIQSDVRRIRLAVEEEDEDGEEEAPEDDR